MTLSVVIPVYNVKAYLGACLDSVLKQTFTDFEVIAIDDGSSDESAEILSRYASVDSRITVYSQSNRGLGATRNRGLVLARGEFVYFMDSDDLLEPNAFEVIIAGMREHALDELIFSAKAFGDGEASAEIETRVKAYDGYYEIAESIAGKVVDGAEMMARQLETGHLFVSVPLRAFRTSALRESGLRFVEGVVREDESFTIAVNVALKRVMAICDRFYLRRVRLGSLASGGEAARHIEGLLFAAIGLQSCGIVSSSDDRLRHVGDFLLRNYARAIDAQLAEQPRAIEEALELMREHAASSDQIRRAEEWLENRSRTSPDELKWRCLRKLRRIVQEVFRR